MMRRAASMWVAPTVTRRGALSVSVAVSSRSFHQSPVGRDAASGFQASTIEPLTVEFVTDPSSEASPSVAFDRSAGVEETVVSSEHLGEDDFESVAELDVFARAKVLNFIKKRQGTPSSFDMREIQEDDNTTLFHASLTLPLPAECGVRKGEGLGESQKDAEVLAAMHAERIIDALGIQLCALSSTQKRHAEAARAQGRWAPMPGDEPRPVTTPSPPPLKKVLDGDDIAASSADDVDPILGVPYALVKSRPISPLKCTLASPEVLDASCKPRIRQLLSTLGCNPTFRIKVAKPGDSEQDYIARIKLPVPTQFGNRLAVGRAPTKPDAVTLACMHAELIVDAIGLPLFPNDMSKQQQHVAECTKMGRWAPVPVVEGDTSQHRPQADSPPPMRLPFQDDAGAPVGLTEEVEVAPITTTISVDGEEPAAAAPVSRTLDATEELVQHGEAALKGLRTFVHLAAVDPAAVDDVDEWIRHDGGAPRYVFEAIGPRRSPTFRASLPLPNNVPLDAAGQPRIAIGVADTEENAKVACAMHAIQIAGVLGIALFPNSDTCQKELADRVTAAGGAAVVPGMAPSAAVPSTASPPPFKVKSSEDKLGRSSAAFALSEKIDANRFVREVSEGNKLQTELEAARKRVPVERWSLTPDLKDESGIDWIQVDTGSKTGGGGESFGHTMRSLRAMDAGARGRLVDYLERHGVNPTAAIGTVQSGTSGYRSTVELPVPARAGPRTAMGEASTAVVAETLAAMHAELILDTLGLPLYDARYLQIRHARAARSQGREAPLTAGRVVATKAMSTPPALREASTAVDGNTAALSASPLSAAQASDATAAVPSYVPFAVSDVVPSIKLRMEAYLRRHNVTLSAVEIYAVSTSATGKKEHHASLQVPVPPEFGVRTARAIADNRKQAFLMCLTNAEHLVDALGLPLEVNPDKQRRHVQFAKAAGRKAPMPGTPPNPTSTPTPPGYRASVLAAESLSFPTPPSDEEVNSTSPGPGGGNVVWNAYVRESAAFLKKENDSALLESLAQDAAIRTGDPLLDNTLDRIERCPIDPHAKRSLQKVFEKHSLPLEAFPEIIDCTAFGKGGDKKFHASATVVGTPLVCQGAAPNPQQCRARLYMHYKHVIEAIVASHESKQQSGALFDAGTGTFSSAGQDALLELFCLAVDGVPLKSQVKQLPTFDANTAPLTKVLLTAEDRVRRIRSVGSGTGPDEAASRTKAVAELFQRLSADRPEFAALCHAVKDRPTLDLNAAKKVSCGAEETVIASIAEGLDKLPSVPPPKPGASKVASDRLPEEIETVHQLVVGRQVGDEKKLARAGDLLLVNRSSATPTATHVGLAVAAHVCSGCKLSDSFGRSISDFLGLESLQEVEAVSAAIATGFESRDETSSDAFLWAFLTETSDAVADGYDIGSSVMVVVGATPVFVPGELHGQLLKLRMAFRSAVVRLDRLPSSVGLKIFDVSKSLSLEAPQARPPAS